MDDPKRITRRDFIKNTMTVGGSLLLATCIPANGTVIPSVPLSSSSETTGKELSSDMQLLKGVCDIHLHAAPDSRVRSVNEIGFARDAYQAGYRGVMFKSNDFSCHDRAFIVRQELSDFECFGSICMNRVYGDKVNVYAAEKAVKTIGHYCRCIWMPTLDSAYQYICEKRKEKGIPVLDDSGKVLLEVVRIMEICAEADIIFATGHSSPQESIVLAEKAREVGVGKFVVTHANSHFWKMSHDQIKHCVDLGAFIEYCYLPCLWGEGTSMPQYERMSNDEFASFVRIAPERSFISTDLGQSGMPHPMEGMRICIAELLKNGMSQRDIDFQVRINPARLIGLQ